MDKDLELFKAFLEEHPVEKKMDETSGSDKRIPIKHPQSELDLHGNTLDEANLYLTRFLSDSRMKGYQLVRVITGKGLHSKTPGKLRNFVETGLNHGRFGRIRSFRSGKAREGGSGVFLIDL